MRNGNGMVGGRCGRDSRQGPRSDQFTFLPESMSDASTTATVKDIPNDALTVGLTNTVPVVPAPGSTPVIPPQNAVPSQPSFVGSIIGDKCVHIQNSGNFDQTTDQDESRTLRVAPTSRPVSVSWYVAPLPS